MRAGLSVIGLALLICPRVVRKNGSAGHACFQLDILLIAKSGHDRRRYAETLRPGIGVLLHCCQVVGFHHQRASTGVRVDLSCQHLEAGIFIHGLAAFDVIHDGLGVYLISGIRSAPLDQETCLLKALRDCQILALTAECQRYQSEHPDCPADLTHPRSGWDISRSDLIRVFGSLAVFTVTTKSVGWRWLRHRSNSLKCLLKSATGVSSPEP